MNVGFKQDGIDSTEKLGCAILNIDIASSLFIHAGVIPMAAMFSLIARCTLSRLRLIRWSLFGAPDMKLSYAFISNHLRNSRANQGALAHSKSSGFSCLKESRSSTIDADDIVDRPEIVSAFGAGLLSSCCFLRPSTMSAARTLEGGNKSV